MIALYVPELLCKTHVVLPVLVSMMAVVYVFSSMMYQKGSYRRTMWGIGIIGTFDIALI